MSLEKAYRCQYEYKHNDDADDDDDDYNDNNDNPRISSLPAPPLSADRRARPGHPSQGRPTLLQSLIARVARRTCTCRWKLFWMWPFLPFFRLRQLRAAAIRRQQAPAGRRASLAAGFPFPPKTVGAGAPAARRRFAAALCRDPSPCALLIFLMRDGGAKRLWNQSTAGASQAKWQKWVRGPNLAGSRSAFRMSTWKCVGRAPVRFRGMV